MPWNSTCPVGSNSVKDNKDVIQENITYIKTTMQNDHYWDEDATKDGYHKKVETVNQSADPVALAGGTNCLYYSRLKTVAESSTYQKTEPFIYSKSGAANHYLQLGFRAMIHFTVGASPGFTISTLYSHNCSVARDTEGLFTLTFTNALPSANYIPFGTALRGSSNPLVICPRTGTKASSITTTTFKFGTYSTSDSARDPTVVMLAICGG